MKRAISRCTGTCYISGVLWNTRFKQDNMITWHLNSPRHKKYHVARSQAQQTTWLWTFISLNHDRLDLK